ncbi:hypothetical protein BSL78_10734 [Apostichopus japonicus]|uniref:WD repeat-containing protein 11 n=1 Tax=Stichopus japonicus TaxID=307972 RepID=A0A2G8KWH9_STIJA|nr:hypothetical protein BSL78_10734 [Apostichopus japonicus]
MIFFSVTWLVTIIELHGIQKVSLLHGVAVKLFDFSTSLWHKGCQSLFAYGCHTAVVVVDTKTIQVLQTLDNHRTNVVKVKWAKEHYTYRYLVPYTLRLASAESNGLIIIWDVANGCPRTSFSEGTKGVGDLEWLSTQDASHDLLLALHPPYSVVLWNADTGTKLWKKSFTDSLQALAFDPFEPSNLTLLGQDSLIFISDFSLSKPPSSNGRKFYITTSTPQGTASTTTAEKKQNIGGARTAFKRVRMIVGDSKPGNSNSQPEEQDTSLQECIQFCYLKSQRHHLVLVYAREILVLDLEIRQTVTTIPMDRSGSPFINIHPLRHRDMLMCLHENGTISVRMYKKTGTIQAGNAIPSDMEISYDLKCQSDPLRVTKHMKTFGFSVSPVTDVEAALLMSDGRILCWSLITVEHAQRPGSSKSLSQLSSSPLYSPPGGILPSNGDFEFLPPLGANLDQNLKNLPTPKMSICDLIQSSDRSGTPNQTVSGRSVSLKFVLTGFVSGVSLMPTVVKMCPPLTTKNFHIYKPLLAVGTTSGMVQVFTLLSGTPYREYNIHTSCVRGIEWLSLSCFLSFSHPNPGSSGLVRNEVLVLDLQTGQATHLRENKGEEPPIEAAKVSHLKQYIIITFKEKPFEIWDLRTYTLLREMKKSFPPISALEWSPTVKKKSINTDLFGSTPHLETAGLQSMLPASESNSDTRIGLPVLTKEHFVFAEASGPLHHFVIENTTIKEGSRLPANNGLNYIACMAWKGEMIVMADPDGVIGVWDLKNKMSRCDSSEYFHGFITVYCWSLILSLYSSRNYPTGRSGIKKVRFAPGVVGPHLIKGSALLYSALAQNLSDQKAEDL